MPAIEAAFAVVVATYLAFLTVAMGYLAFVVSARQNLELVRSSSDPTDSGDSDSVA